LISHGKPGKQGQQWDDPLLATIDIGALPARYLARRDLDKEELFRQMELRHKKRKVTRFSLRRTKGEWHTGTQ
jgi:hypothetical protein